RALHDPRTEEEARRAIREQRAAERDRQLGTRGADEADEPGIESAVEVLVLSQEPHRGRRRDAPDRGRWVDRRYQLGEPDARAQARGDRRVEVRDGGELAHRGRGGYLD